MSAIDGPVTTSQRDSPLADDTPDLVQDGGSNDDNEDDLFGDDDEEDIQPGKPRRTLDDPDLDSGDDLERADRLAETVEDDGVPEEDQGRPVRLVECDVPRLNYPPGTEFYLLNLPDFLGIKHEAFDLETYIPQSIAHDGDPNRQTSAYSTAMSSMFWRYDPSEKTKTTSTLSTKPIQSTARLIRWSDNSMTLQLATKPTEQYKIATTGLKSSFNKPKPQHHVPYDPSKDSHTFLAAAHQTPVIDLQLIRALDATMKIHPSGGATDESELRLRQALAVQQEDHDPLARMKDVKEDPELARKQAEQFEKERMRAQRKRENAEERMTMKRNNVLGRSGLSSGRSGGAGLSVAGLEDDEGMPMSRGKKSKTTRKTNRHGEIYSDDEDETLPRGRTREDEYDRDDAFLADSDEEPEQYEDDEELLDDEEEEDDGEDESGPRRKSAAPVTERKRERTPKRNRMDELTDADASGEEDTTVSVAAGAGPGGTRQSPQQARKKRRVIDDDDEDDEE